MNSVIQNTPSILSYLKFDNFDSLQSYLNGKAYIIPDFQRQLDTEYVGKLVNSIINWYNLYNEYPPIPVICFCVVDGKYFLIDGQHRLEAIKKLFEDKIYITFDISVYTVSNMEKCKYYFSNLNTVKSSYNYFVDVPELEKKSLIVVCNKWLLELGTFKDRPCNRPYIWVENFMSEFIKTKHYNECKTLKDFQDKFWYLNGKLRNEFLEGKLRYPKLEPKTIETIKNNKIYFSLLKDGYFLPI